MSFNLAKIFFLGKTSSYFFLNGQSETNSNPIVKSAFLIQSNLDGTIFSDHCSSYDYFGQMTIFSTQIFLSAFDGTNFHTLIYNFDGTNIDWNNEANYLLPLNSQSQSGNVNGILAISGFIYNLYTQYYLSSSIRYSYIALSQQGSPSQIQTYFEFPSINYRNIYNPQFYYLDNLNYLIPIDSNTAYTFVHGNINQHGNDFFINKIDFINPDISNPIIIGGEGDYIPWNHLELSNTYLICGNDGIGMFFIEILKSNYNINSEQKFRLPSSIIYAELLSSSGNKILAFGTSLDQLSNYNSFIAELGNYYFPKTINPLTWMTDVEIYCALLSDSSSIMVAGSKKINGDKACYFAQIRFDYSLISDNANSFYFTGVDCRINDIIKARNNEILGIGYTSGSSSIIALSISHNTFSYFASSATATMTRLIEIVSQTFVASGSILVNGGANTNAYFITFNQGLSLISNLADNRYTNSLSKNIIAISESLFASVGTCGNIACLNFLDLNPLKIADSILHSTSSTSFNDIMKISSSSFLVIGNQVMIDTRKGLLTLYITIPDSCPNHFSLDYNSMK